MSKETSKNDCYRLILVLISSWLVVCGRILSTGRAIVLFYFCIQWKMVKTN